jgi:hypothetical protein
VANAAREKFVGSACENCHKIITVSRMLRHEFGVKKPDAELIVPDKTPWVININLIIFKLKFSIPSTFFFRNSDRPTTSKNIEHYVEDPDGMMRLGEQSLDYSIALRTGSANMANNIVSFQRQRIEDGFKVAQDIMSNSTNFALTGNGQESETIPSAVSTAVLQKLMNDVVGVRA